MNLFLVKKPIKKGLKITQNIIKYEVGALNIEETRISYAEGEAKVGHNLHPENRVTTNIIRTEEFNDNYDIFLVPKVRQKKESFNFHPTLKPIELMFHLVKFVSFENQKVLNLFWEAVTQT